MTKLSTLLFSTSLLASCVAIDEEPPISSDEVEPAADDLSEDATAMFTPCFYTNYQLSQIATQAASTLQMNGATGWSVVAMRRIEGQANPCVGTSSGGFARSNADGYLAMTTTTQIPIASQSKLITAVAVRKILAEHGISPGAKIAPYLPSSWWLGPGVSNLTFADLLTHETGLFNSGNTGLAGGWGADLVADMKTWLMVGVIEPDTYDYANSHMLLLQLLAARIEFGTSVYGVGSAMFVYSGQLLEAYIRGELFFPHGIGTSGPVPTCTFDSSSALRYASGASSSALGAGITPVTDYERCGFGRWNLTPRNFALFLDRLYNEDLLGNLTTDFMAAGYGFDPTAQDYWTKGGNLPGGSQQWKNKSYIFPDGTVVMAQINSNSAIGTAVPDAYNAVMP